MSDYPGQQPERNRAAIRRVLALAPDQLPPGPGHPTQACPLCDALIASGPAALQAHKQTHATEEERARRRAAATNRRNAAERLRRMNEARRNPAPAPDLEDADAVELAPAGQAPGTPNDDEHQAQDEPPFTPAPSNPEQEQLTL